MQNTYKIHFFSKAGKGQTLCNQKSAAGVMLEGSVYMAGGQDTTFDKSLVTCAKCLSLLSKDVKEAKQVKMHEKALREARREVKDFQGWVKEYEKAETMTEFHANALKNFRESLAEAEAKLIALEGGSK